MNNFVGIKHFSPADGFGDASKMDHGLLLKLDQLREKINSPIIVTSGWRAHGSTADSQHPLGRAADVIAPKLSLKDFYLAAEGIGFPGLGVYPHWRYGGVRVGGLHLDVRTGKPGRWMGVPTSKAGGQSYIGLNQENLELWGVV